jgi:hypothetical protein
MLTVGISIGHLQQTLFNICLLLEKLPLETSYCGTVCRSHRLNVTVRSFEFEAIIG